MKQRRSGFTLIELLVVIGIIALLLSIALPAFNVVRGKAKETALRGVLYSISNGLESYKSDMGDYPSSTPWDPSGDGSMLNTGAHNLAEAMFGRDQLGYQQDHWYEVDVSGTPVKPVGSNKVETTRWGPYVETDNINIGYMSDSNIGIPVGSDLATITSHSDYGPVWTNNAWPVIKDEFDTRYQLPVLYYKANTRAKMVNEFFRYGHNWRITSVFGMYGQHVVDSFSPATGNLTSGDLKAFPYYSYNPDSTGALNTMTARPFKKDSFLLISAGRDGVYGTEDDVNNFTR